MPMLKGTVTLAAFPFPTQPGASKIVTPPFAAQPAIGSMVSAPATANSVQTSAPRSARTIAQMVTLR
jgi:hypothetical protein